MGSNLQPPTFTQVLAWKLLSTWGYETYRAHVVRVAALICSRRDEGRWWTESSSSSYAA